MSKYVLNFLQTDNYWKQISELSSGIAQPGVNAAKLQSLCFPLSPLSEQQRIVDCIESLFAKLDEAKQKAQDALGSFETCKAAILHKAFTGELTAQWRKEHGVGMESWDTKPLLRVTKNHDSERIPLSQAERSNLARVYDYYGASGVIDKVDRFLFEGRKLLIGEDGANLVTRSKPIAFIAEGQYWVNNHAHVLSVTSEMLLDFLCHYINSIDLTPYVTGSAQPKMTQAKMNTIPVPVPTVDEQAEIVRILDDLLDKEQQAKEAAEGVLGQIDLIKKAILARAFRGELGTNDPSEESAVELVKRVLAVEPPPKARAKAVSIPREVEEQLKCELERKIIKLYYYSDSQSLPINTLMEVSSKKFEVLESIRNLEQRNIIKKLPNGNYKLVR